MTSFDYKLRGLLNRIKKLTFLESMERARIGQFLTFKFVSLAGNIAGIVLILTYTLQYVPP